MVVLEYPMYGACRAVHGVTHGWHIADVPPRVWRIVYKFVGTWHVPPEIGSMKYVDCIELFPCDFSRYRSFNVPPLCGSRWLHLQYTLLV